MYNCLATATNPNRIEFQGHRSYVTVTWFLVFFCVPDAAATCGQYLALSKAWWCCLLFIVCVFPVAMKCEVLQCENDRLRVENLRFRHAFENSW